jgi:hypothetical protein
MERLGKSIHERISTVSNRSSSTSDWSERNVCAKAGRAVSKSIKGAVGYKWATEAEYYAVRSELCEIIRIQLSRLDLREPPTAVGGF